MNSRWSKFSGSDLDLKNSILQKHAEKSMCWKGYFQFHKTEGRLCSLRMLKEPPAPAGSPFGSISSHQCVKKRLLLGPDLRVESVETENLGVG